MSIFIHWCSNKCFLFLKYDVYQVRLWIHCTCWFLSVCSVFLSHQRRGCEPGGPVWSPVHRADSRSWIRRYRPWAPAHQPPAVYTQELRWVCQIFLSTTTKPLLNTVNHQLISLIVQWFFHTLQARPTAPVTPCLPWQQTTSSLAWGANLWSKSSSYENTLASEDLGFGELQEI